MSGNNRRWNNRSYLAGNGGSMHLSVIDQYLKDNGIRRKSIPKDGCCLFRAVADQVYLTQTSHWDLRRMCASYIKHHHTKFHSFMTVSYKDYCWKLANCNLWGGEMELVALSELLERDIHVYHEQDGKVQMKKFVPAGVALTEPTVLLLFSGNNHYDSLWKSREESTASMCQSIIYELLLTSVMGMKMSDRDMSKAMQLRGYDFTQRLYVSQPILDKYPHDLLRGLTGLSFFNIPYKVYKREKEACEKADRKLAVSLQFIIGDKVHVTYEGSQYTGDILSGINNNMVEVFVEDIKKRVKVPFSDIKTLPQQKSHYNKTYSSRSGRSSKSSSNNNNVNGDNSTHTPKRSYLKNSTKTRSSKQQQQQQANIGTPSPPNQPSPTPLQEQVSSIPGGPTIDNPPLPMHEVESEQILASNQQQQQQPMTSAGFSEYTVRMSNLMGRTLDMFNQASLASINEAPESEWPILNAGSLRNRYTTVMAGANPQRCHLDGPPPPAALEQQLPTMPPQQQLPFMTAPTGFDNQVDHMKLLIKEMDPPLELLKTGSAEGRQRFMFKFAQNCLLFYSKYISDPELEDSFSDLLYMEFEDFIATPPHQRDFSVATSLTSRDGSQTDIHSDNTTVDSDVGNTSRVISEDHTSSPCDNVVYSPPQCNGHVTDTPPSGHVTATSPSTLSPHPTTDTATTTVPEPVIENGDTIDGVPPTEGTVPPTEGTVPTAAMNPYMFAYPPTPGHPQVPYGYPPYPLMLPTPTGHMIPWFYPTMPPYFMPMMQQQQQPQYVRPQSSLTNEEEEVPPLSGGRASSAGSITGSTTVIEGLKVEEIEEDSRQLDHNEQIIERATSPTGGKKEEGVNSMEESRQTEETTTSKKSVKKQESSANEDTKSSKVSSRSFVRGGSSGSSQQGDQQPAASGGNTGGGGARNRQQYKHHDNQYRNNYSSGRRRHHYSQHKQQYHDNNRRKNKEEQSIVNNGKDSH